MAHKVRADFSSVDEFCKAPFTLKENERRCRHTFQSREGYWIEESHRGNTTSWLGAPTAKQAEERVTKGWPEGAQRVLNNMANIDVEFPVSVRRKLARADQGDELDIHTVYAGGLDHAWSKRQRKHIRSPLTVRIVVQTNLLQDMSPEQLFWRGAAAVKLSDLLTSAGYNVEIIGALASTKVCSRGEVDFLATMTLKESKQPLDIDGLAGVVCNAGFHRLFGFRAYMAIADWPVTSDPGSSVSDRSGRVIKDGGLQSDTMLTFVTPYEVVNKAAAEKFVTECCEWLNQPQDAIV